MSLDPPRRTRLVCGTAFGTSATSGSATGTPIRRGVVLASGRVQTRPREHRQTRRRSQTSTRIRRASSRGDPDPPPDEPADPDHVAALAALLDWRYRLNVALEWLGDGAYEDAAEVLSNLLDEVDAAIRAERRAA